MSFIETVNKGMSLLNVYSSRDLFFFIYPWFGQVMSNMFSFSFVVCHILIYYYERTHRSLSNSISPGISLLLDFYVSPSNDVSSEYNHRGLL